MEEVDVSQSETRAGERAVQTDGAFDAGLWFIGRIRTPWATRADCPRQGDAQAGPICTVEIGDAWQTALEGIDAFEQLELLYWLDQSRRDLVLQKPRHAAQARGTFALRSPVRPNPIGVSRVTLLECDGSRLRVRGLDCLDGTPLIDLKPDRCAHSPRS